jgi:hypothetical protein
VSCSFTIINNSQIQAIVPNVPAQSGIICLRTPEKCNYCSTANFTINASVTLNLKLILEGLYEGNGLMRPVLYTTEMSGNTIACDTVIVELHNPNAPYGLVTLVKGMLNSSGNCSIILPGSVTGNSYYIALRHRNSLETWSKNPVLFTSPSVNFDFSTP